MLIFMLIFLVSLFSSLLNNLLPFIGSLVSFLGIIFLVVYLIIIIVDQQIIKQPVKVNLLAISIMYIMLLSISNMVLSTLLNTYHNTVIQIFLTLYGNLKFMLVFFCGYALFKKIHLEKTIIFMKVISQVFTFICLFIYGLNQFVPLMKGFGERFGIQTYAFGFQHPAQFALVVIIFSILRVFFSLLYEKSLPYSYLVANLCLVFVAGRSTSIAFYTGFILYIFLYPYIRQFIVLFYGTIGIFLLGITWERINSQLIENSGEARGVLLRTSLKIAKEEQFPFGIGLGMFGSHASRVQYSPYYSKYHVDTYWGLSRVSNQFITDSYWAMIIAETGFLGFILQWTLLAVIAITIWKIQIKGPLKQIQLVIASPLIYAIFTSLVDTVFVSKSIVIIMLTIVYMLIINNQKQAIVEN